MTNIIPTMSTPARDRYPTDSEVRRIKVAGIYATARRDAKPGTKRPKNPSGLMLAALVDMAYLTGQRISDLLSLEWSAIGRDGIVFKPSKTSKSTGASVLIGWTPKLEDVVRRLKELRKERRAFGVWVFTKVASKKGMAKAGQHYTYSGAHSAWVRACVGTVRGPDSRLRQVSRLSRDYFPINSMLALRSSSNAACRCRLASGDSADSRFSNSMHLASSGLPLQRSLPLGGSAGATYVVIGCWGEGSLLAIRLEFATELASAVSNAMLAREIATRITIAGIAAIAHFTMNTTIEPNGMRMSVTTTSKLDLRSIILFCPR